MKNQKELLIAAQTKETAANIGGATIHKMLNIDGHIQKQQFLAKNP